MEEGKRVYQLLCNWAAESGSAASPKHGEWKGEAVVNGGALLGSVTEDGSNASDLLIGVLTKNGASICKYSANGGSPVRIWFDVFPRAQGSAGVLYGNISAESGSNHEYLGLGDAAISVTESPKLDYDKVYANYEKIKAQVAANSSKAEFDRFLEDFVSDIPRLTATLKEYKLLFYDEEIPESLQPAQKS